jgi:hypothetical protein
MRKRKARKEIQTLSLSFLDAISCGFGAVILLFVIAKMFEPVRLEENRQELQFLIERYQDELADLLAQAERLDAQEIIARREVVEDQVQVADLQSELTRIRSELLDQRDDADVSAELAGRLARARQQLTDEMRQLLADYERPRDDYAVGGIPVDSEYLIFIVDTSGSMLQFAWDSVLRQLEQTLEVYPQLKGIQVMSDMGGYLFASTRREWIEDSPQRRRAILDAARNWQAFSNSTPREGIITAIDHFYDPDKKIALHIYGDDFAVGSINAVVREVDRRNRLDAQGNRRVRIHAVAFPALWEATGGEHYSAAQYATLMRVLTQRNGGSFIALPTRRDQRR